MENRIQKLLKSVNDSEAVFISSYPNIFYYSGFKSEDAFLLISKDKRLIITDSRYTVQAKEQAAGFEVIDISCGFKNIFSKISENRIGFEEQNVTVAQYEKYKSALGNKELFAMQKKINAPRQVKDKDEIKKITEAERLGDEAFTYVLDKIKDGTTEKDIAFELEFYMRRHGASDSSFDTIAASGVRGAMPHGLASDKAIKSGELLTLDFGCVLDGYCSDMTRTVAVGVISDWQHEIYDIVLKAQTSALKAVSAGKQCSEIDAAARKIITDAGYGKNFGHALGHSVGIEIHENPNFSPKSKDTVEIGNVITVEPGIYIDGMGGVRIEDVIAVTENGTVNITHSPKELIIK